MLLPFTRSILIAVASMLVVARASAQLVEGLPENDYAPDVWYPSVYEGLGRSFAGVRFGGDKPRNRIAAGVIRAGHGCVVVLAPKSRRVVMEIGGGEDGQSFGESLASHASTLVIGEAAALEGRGRVRVVDIDHPKDGRWLEGFEGARGFGATLLASPDRDGAGFHVLIGALRTPGVADGARGAVALYSDAAGVPVWIQRALGDEVEFGLTLAQLDDIDGDGLRDLAVQSHRAARGVVTILSGRDGKRLREWVSETERDGFGSGLASVQDLDGDGRGDLAIGIPLSPCRGGTAGRVRLVSTATGAVLREIVANCQERGHPGDDAEYGAALVWLRANPSVEPELVVAAPEGFFNGTDLGYADILSIEGSRRCPRLGWRYSGLCRPERFGETLVVCALDLDRPQPVLLIGGRRSAWNDIGGGLQVRNPDGGEMLWEIFGVHLEPPD